jgi:hypothetical protein
LQDMPTQSCGHGTRQIAADGTQVAQASDA